MSRGRRKRIHKKKKSSLDDPGGVVAAVVMIASSLAGSAAAAAAVLGVTSVLGTAIVGGALIGAVVGGASAAIQGQNVFKGMAIGAIGGAVTGGFASGLGAAGASSFSQGVIRGGIAGALGGGAAGASGAALNGQNIGQGFKHGAIVGGLTGAVAGGVQGYKNSSIISEGGTIPTQQQRYDTAISNNQKFSQPGADPTIGQVFSNASDIIPNSGFIASIATSGQAGQAIIQQQPQQTTPQLQKVEVAKGGGTQTTQAPQVIKPKGAGISDILNQGAFNTSSVFHPQAGALANSQGVSVSMLDQIRQSIAAGRIPSIAI